MKGRLVIWFFILASALGLEACFKPDEPFPVDVSERITLVDTTFGPAQIFYSLKDRKIIAKNSIYAWDIAFDCKEGSFTIRLNSAKGMGAHLMESRDFERDYSHDKFDFRFDNPNGSKETTAIGQWGDFNFTNPQSFENVYIIHRGWFEEKRPIGMKKMVILGYKDSAYQIKFAELDGSQEYTIQIPKSKNRQYVYYTFEEGGKEVSVEPEKDSWDLLISPYTDTLVHYKYLFGTESNMAVYDGVLLNRYNREVALDSIRPFEQINFRHLDLYTYVRHNNAIGRRFWYWDDVFNRYAVKEKPIYVLKDNNGNYYKIRFLNYGRDLFGHLTLSFDLKNL